MIDDSFPLVQFKFTDSWVIKWLSIGHDYIWFMQMDSDDDRHFYDGSILDDNKKTNYKILNESDIQKIQKEDNTRVCSLLSVPKTSACILLCHYKWNVESLLDTWLADEERVIKDAGLARKGLETSISDSIEFTCGICFDVFPAHDKIIKSYDHVYCTTCLGTDISIAIDEGPGCLSLRCPDPKCNAPFGEDIVNLLVSEECKRKYYQYFVRAYVEGNSNVKWCPAPDCSSVIQYIGANGGKWSL
ncbi:Zinc finger, C6HC-type [Heracleum sosnowskyi]|uniref:RBR-type E3 ubiquitin transferase n=1 Tax=Heracleum sosnowskyi TaxID=360622 RepID=A0AAD8M2T5_9APIA|nr:Zinc finger, C6HC-type [Heracleum sosnowskyi]